MKGMDSFVERRKESDLIADILAGDGELYHQLIRPYERSVYIMSLSFVRNEEDAEDIAQETFIRAFLNLRAFRGDSKFSTWLISIALNEARSRLRRRTTVRLTSLDAHQSKDGPESATVLRDWRELPFDVVVRKEIGTILRRAVDRLPPMYQKVFLLRDVQELTVRETAQILNINRSLVRVRLHRARMMLQRLLAPELY